MVQLNMWLPLCVRGRTHHGHTHVWNSGDHPVTLNDYPVLGCRILGSLSISWHFLSWFKFWYRLLFWYGDCDLLFVRTRALLSVKQDAHMHLLHHKRNAILYSLYISHMIHSGMLLKQPRTVSTTPMLMALGSLLGPYVLLLRCCYCITWWKII